ncbi:MAG: UDP-3-O-acyl-N-acetylglucosamine deacetylase [Bacteroidales bacterium]|nr:UDP-3-O-acyl-N-acetylglucosamine deacetylase [Bacteroidales bacterium]
MQHTLKQSYTFNGKGLHTGAVTTMTIRPAEPGSGICFRRTDIGSDAVVKALATNVTSTDRGTTISCNGASVSTIEHLMSAAAALGVDNMMVDIDGPEVPILDGSALPYVKAIMTDGLAAQDAVRRTLVPQRPFHFEDDASGATIDIYPAEGCEMQLTVDFNSKVLGVQRFKYDTTVDYATQIAPCRTFCFFHELEFLAGKGLIKGGDMDNAIVIVEHPVDDATLERMRGLFHAGHLEVNEGYLNNLQLHFPDEIVRHKMLDMIGDFALLGAPIKGTIIACKTGHRINTAVCKSLLQSDILKLS